MSIFSGISAVTSDAKSEYLTEGEYQLDLRAVRLINSKKSNDDFFIVEFTVTKSRGDQSAPAGTEAAWVCKMGGQYPESALRDVNDFVKAATGATDAEITDDLIDSMVENDGADIAGLKVRCSVTEKPTQRGGVFSKHTFRPPLAADSEIPF
tara:strand:- start:19332 stop:19787 length:456 start_codon:yes stop_codon:yes gene_type:complete